MTKIALLVSYSKSKHTREKREATQEEVNALTLMCEEMIWLDYFNKYYPEGS